MEQRGDVGGAGVTFSLAGRCRQSGQLGLCTATSDVAVGARVPWAEAGVGAVLTQNRTDPRLGPRGLALMRSGCDAASTIAALAASSAQRRWRQLAAIDAGGETAVFHGELLTEDVADARGRDCVAIGNLLTDRSVCRRMVECFAHGEGDPLAERLTSSLEAGLAAGGERWPLRSAALLVVAGQPFPLVDLRVDLHQTPVAGLRSLWEAYRPLVDEFVTRALDPDHAGGTTGRVA